MTLLERAEEYAGLLAEGSEILDDTDAAVVAPFKHLLGAVLWRKQRLYLDRRDDRYVVTATPPWLLRRLRGMQATAQQNRIVCRKCEGAWFDCNCEAQLIVGGVRAPVLPWIGSMQARAVA